MALLWFDLDLNKPPTKTRLLSRFGLGTWLSLLRLLCISLLAGFLFAPLPAGWLAWVPFALNLVCNFTDFSDGYAARVTGSVTRLGEKLDQDLDGRGVLVATLLAFHYGAVGWWFLLVGLARYLWLFGLWLRRRAGLPFYSFPNRLRRPFAGVQMGIGTALFAPSLPHEATFFISSFSMLPFLGNFAYDWLVSVKTFHFYKKDQKRIADAWQKLSSWSLLAVRFLFAALMVARVSQAASDPYLILELAAAFLLLLGLGGRPLAFVFLLLTGLRLLGQIVQPADLAALSCGLTLLYLGVGAFSLRNVPETWIFRSLGGKS